MQVIISTVGTSLITNNIEDREKIKQIMGKPLEEKNQYEDLLKSLEDELLRKINNSHFDSIRFSAETNSLTKMGVSEGDCLYFLTSDTIDGYLCGKVLKTLSEKKWKATSEFYVVNGLQVLNALTFRKHGLDSLVEQITKILSIYPPSAFKVTLNPTGGFKAVVPYVTLLGLIEGVPVKYIYERSNQLITLPSAPLKLDLARLTPLEPVIKILCDDYMPPEEVCRETGLSLYELQNQFQDVLVWEDGLVTLSALARLIYLREGYQKGDRYRISKTVQKKFQKDPYLKKVFYPLFDKMRDPQYRAAHLHNEVQSDRVDLDCCKPGNVSERIFYFVEDDCIYICDIFLHDQYEWIINNHTLLKRSFIGEFD